MVVRVPSTRLVLTEYQTISKRVVDLVLVEEKRDDALKRIME